MPSVSVLKKRADFLRTAGSGFKFVKPSLIVQSRRRLEEEISVSDIRIGFTATKRLGNAVARNRAKRRLRAAVAQVIPELGSLGCDYVFIGREQTSTALFTALLNDTRHALKRLAEQMSR